MIDKFELVWDQRPVGDQLLTGWCKADRPDFKPAFGFLVAHDTLEHTNDRLPGFEDELVALGRGCWIRRDTIKYPNLLSPPHIITVDIAELWMKHGGDDLPLPDRSVLTEVDGYIREAVDGLSGYTPTGAYDIDHYHHLLCQLDCVRDWLKIGAADAQNRYGTAGVATTRAAAIKITDHFAFDPETKIGRREIIEFNRLTGEVVCEQT